MYWPPVKVNIQVNGFAIPMEVDNDASTSLLNWDTFQKINISSQFVLWPQNTSYEHIVGKLFPPKE